MSSVLGWLADCVWMFVYLHLLFCVRFLRIQFVCWLLFLLCSNSTNSELFVVGWQKWGAISTQLSATVKIVAIYSGAMQSAFSSPTKQDVSKIIISMHACLCVCAHARVCVCVWIFHQSKLMCKFNNRTHIRTVHNLCWVINTLRLYGKSRNDAEITTNFKAANRRSIFICAKQFVTKICSGNLWLYFSIVLSTVGKCKWQARNSRQYIALKYFNSW